MVRYMFLLLFLFLTFLVMNILRKHCMQSRQQEMYKLIKWDIEELQSCSAIIEGDMDGVDQDHFSQLLSSNKVKSSLSEDFYINATTDCQAFITDRGYFTVSLSKEEKDFPIAYSMVIHEKIEMFERLLRAVYTPQNVYCVHVDKKSSDSLIQAVKAITSCFPNVFLASKMESVVYASWSRVQADLNCIDDLLKHPVQWRYLLNTCGTDFPIKTNAEIVQSLKHLNGKNSMESEITNSYKKQRWEYHHNVSKSVIRTSIKKTPPPINTPMYSGNAYFVVTRDFVEHLFSSSMIQTFMEWEKDTYSPDEHMWATLQRMPSVPGSNPPNQKYDESDMMSIARLVKWSYHEGSLLKGAPYLPCTGKHRHAVCVYGAGDLNWIVRQKHLFANKFDPQVDSIAIQCLEAYLHYKAINGQSLLSTDEMK
ncbi:beta-1,3-galactosyl-O-glycosyl-glycoprotein beta-1,6-N-acetylglucosaminyltransferase 3 [Trichomycterus rosablanca]|uniref:beta-1,3-galactosyl-O-glycosyl-glycoprotein beta-1,6-N-acetylglucosaminyltransferase 3 n=1 Tax=Trichomycterus rosablanca TaxID=2290929 RepID=UPI002F359377